MSTMLHFTSGKRDFKLASGAQFAPEGVPDYHFPSDMHGLCGKKVRLLQLPFKLLSGHINVESYGLEVDAKCGFDEPFETILSQFTPGTTRYVGFWHKYQSPGQEPVERLLLVMWFVMSAVNSKPPLIGPRE